MRTELAELQAQLDDLPKDEYGLPPADAAIYTEAVELQLKSDDWPGVSHEPYTFTCLAWGRAVVAGLKADSEFMKHSHGLVWVGSAWAWIAARRCIKCFCPKVSTLQLPGRTGSLSICTALRRSSGL